MSSEPGRWVHPADANGNELPGRVWIDEAGNRWTAPGGVLLLAAADATEAVVYDRPKEPKPRKRAGIGFIGLMAGPAALAALLVSNGPTPAPTTRLTDTVSRTGATAQLAAPAAPRGGANFVSNLVDQTGTVVAAAPATVGGMVGGLMDVPTPPPAPPRVVEREREPDRPRRTAAPPQRHQPPPSSHDSGTSVVIIQDNPPPSTYDPGHDDGGSCDCPPNDDHYSETG